MKQKVLTAAIVGLEIVAVLYLSVVAFALSGWMVSDHEAFMMSDADWLAVGWARFGCWCLVAAVYAVVVALVHRRLGLALGFRVVRWLPLFWLLLIVVASGLGASKFVVEKPYM
jgi:hypothetical protein